VSHCDRHNCAQCRGVPDLFNDSVFRTIVHDTTRGHRVTFVIKGANCLYDYPAEWAREIARRLLDAADEAEALDWKIHKRNPER
jgi:hypothetical protein